MTVVSGAVYCFSGLPFEPRAAVATAEFFTPLAESRERIATVTLPGDPACPDGTQASVSITRVGQAGVESGFYVLFE